MLVAVGIGSFFLTVMAVFYMFSLNSFGAMANYADFGRQNRLTSDMLSKDIRSALYVVSAVPNQIVLAAPDGSIISYTYSPSLRTVTRVNGSNSRVVLKNVAWMAFALYGRPDPFANYNVFPTATAANAKVVGFQWSCSEIVAGPESNTEDIQTAIVSMRNK